MASASPRGIRPAHESSRYRGGWYIDALVDTQLESDSITTCRTDMGPALVLRRFDGVSAQRLTELAKSHGQVLTSEEVIFVRGHPFAVSIEDGAGVEVRWFRDELAINAFWFDAVRLEDKHNFGPVEPPPRHASGATLH